MGNANAGVSKYAVIFDCDGVLVNSEELFSEADREFLEQYGLYYGKDEYVEMSSGITHEAFMEKLHADHKRLYGRDLPADFEARLTERYMSLMTQRLQQIPEVADLLRTLQANNIPYAIATNANLPGTLWKLDHVGLRRYFNHHVYSKDMVPNPKPAPDVYLHAAAQLGYDPRNCFVVEDSVTGATAGVAAGATVIGYAGGSHRAAGYDAQLRRAGVAFVTDRMSETATFILKTIRTRQQTPSGPQP